MIARIWQWFTEKWHPDDSHRILGYVSTRDGDKWTVPPPEEWPEWVCVEMAKRALLMEDNE